MKDFSYCANLLLLKKDPENENGGLVIDSIIEAMEKTENGKAIAQDFRKIKADLMQENASSQMCNNRENQR